MVHDDRNLRLGIPDLAASGRLLQTPRFYYFRTRVYPFLQPSSSLIGLNVHRLCGAIEGRLSHFLPSWFRMGWQSAISQGKIPENTPPWLEIEPGTLRRQTMEIHSFSHYQAIMTDFYPYKMLNEMGRLV